jgi:hypothetical protein
MRVAGLPNCIMVNLVFAILLFIARCYQRMTFICVCNGDLRATTIAAHTRCASCVEEEGSWVLRFGQK